MNQSNQQTMQDLAKGTKPQDLVIPPEIQAFLEGILTDANMSSLDEAMRAEMINQLYARLDSFLVSRIVEAMPDDKLEEFISIQEKAEDKQSVEAYIQQNIPNAQQVFTDAFTEFRELYLTNVAVARNAPQEPEEVAGKKAEEKVEKN